MINSVRNTVLSVLNKNNYGYISPSDFNLFAKQAQMEIFDEYFSSYNKTVNMENSRLSGTDYADIARTISEVLEVFATDNLLWPTNPQTNPINNFYAPSISTTGDLAYMINNVKCYKTIKASGVNDSVNAFELLDSTASFASLNILSGDIVVNATTKKRTRVISVIDDTTISLADDIFLVVDDEYIIYSKSDISEAEKVSNGRIFQLNTSSLTAPTTTYPAFLLINDLIKVYPDTFTTYGSIEATYFRYPKDPKWTYISLFGGEPSFDQSQPDYQDFELPLEDEYKLCMKILQYCGVSIRESEVTQFGMAQEQHQQPSFSQKQ
jgi:hypothetical protein